MLFITLLSPILLAFLMATEGQFHGFEKFASNDAEPN